MAKVVLEIIRLIKNLPQQTIEYFASPLPNKTRPLGEHQDWRGGSLRVFTRFARLEADSVETALSHPTHQRVTRAVGRSVAVNYQGLAVMFEAAKGCEDHIVIFYSFIRIDIGEPKQAVECYF